MVDNHSCALPCRNKPPAADAGREYIPMLLSLSPMVAVALERAQEAREWAAAATDQDDRQFWREMERRWMVLAQSYELAERTDTYLAELRLKKLH
jgi:hypothetical protein